MGKSTISLGLAFQLARRGHKVGLFDADVHGPSLPTQLPSIVSEQRIEVINDGWAVKPLVYNSVKLMSFGWLARLWLPGASASAEVRTGTSPGSLAHMLLDSTLWGDLDYLIIDSPPGTGEIPKSLYTKVPLHGAVVVTTPSSLATVDVIRGIHMLSRFQVPVLALVENMASFQCGNCNKLHFPFGRGHIDDVLAASIRPLPTFSLPIVAQGAVNGGENDPFGIDLRGVLDCLEKSTGSSITLPHNRGLHDRPHWPTIMAMAEVTTC